MSFLYIFVSQHPEFLQIVEQHALFHVKLTSTHSHALRDTQILLYDSKPTHCLFIRGWLSTANFISEPRC